MTRRTPGSVTAVVIVTWLVALATAVTGLIYLLGSASDAFLTTVGISSRAATVVGIVELSLAVITAVVGSALGRGSRVARGLVVALMLLRIASAGYTWAGGSTAATVSAVVSGAFAVLVLALLWNAKASAFFAAR